VNVKSTKRQIITNTLTGWLAVGCRLVIALVMVPFLLKVLGKDGYGLVGLMGVITSFSLVADLGLRQALGRELSEKVAKGDSAGFRTLSATALALYLVIAATLIVVGWVLAPWFVTVFKVSDAYKHDAVWILRLYGSVSVLLSFITPIFTAGLQSFLRFDALNMSQTLTGIVSGALLFVCLSLIKANPLYVWAAVSLAMALVDLLIQWALYRKWCFEGQLSLLHVDFREIKSLFELGGYMYVLQLTNALEERSAPLVVSYFFGTVGVALYQSGARLSQMIGPVVLTLSTQVHPLTTRFHVLNQQDKQRRTLVLGTRYTLLFGLMFCAGIILFSEPFCRLWLSSALGNDYVTVVSVMKLWAVVSVIDYAGAMHWPTLLGMKKLRFVMLLMVPSSILSIAVSIYMVGFTGWGIPGVLAAAILTGLVRRPIVTWYVSKLTGLSLREYIRSAYVPPSILFVLLLLFYFCLRCFTIQSWLVLMGWVAVFGLYGALILAISERKLFIGMWQDYIKG
jgi:O-antigen/teichoic acid export membrane protein